MIASGLGWLWRLAWHGMALDIVKGSFGGLGGILLS